MNDTVQCPLCKGTATELITSKVRFGLDADVHVCRECSLVFMDQTSYDFPEDFYKGQYHQTYLTHVEPDALNPRAYYDKMVKSTAPWVERIIPMLKGDENLLDMGCSTGHVMQALKPYAGKVFGNDLNEKEIAFCTGELGLDVSAEPLGNRFPEHSLDVIVMLFVLEHIADPVDFLQYLKRFLKPDGKIVVLVPGITDPLVKLYDIPEFRSFYYCIEHLYYFNENTLSMVFDQAGFVGTIETLQEYPLANHINWSFLRKPSDTLAARKGLPSMELMDGVPEEAWAELWSRFNAMYKQFLAENGYGDRLWAVVGPKGE